MVYPPLGDIDTGLKLPTEPSVINKVYDHFLIWLKGSTDNRIDYSPGLSKPWFDTKVYKAVHPVIQLEILTLNKPQIGKHSIFATSRSILVSDGMTESWM